jgi:hypothetical protein
MHTSPAAHRTTGPAPSTPASIVLVALAARLTPRGDAAIIVARLKHELERLDDVDRAYVVDLVQRHIIAGDVGRTA